MKVSKVRWGTHFFVPVKDVAPELPRLRDALTIRSRYDPELAIPAFVEDEEWFGLPRYYLHNRLFVWDYSVFKDYGINGVRIPLVVRGEFRSGQRDLIDSFGQELDRGTTGFLIQAPTGSGKTFVALKMLEKIGNSALIVVPKSDLIDHWLLEIRTFTSLLPDSIGVGIAGSIDWRGKDLVVAMSDTVAMDRFGDEFRNRFGVILIDEADSRIPARTMNKVLSMFSAKYRIAMSATVRKDGLGELINLHVAQRTLVTRQALKMEASVLRVRYKDENPRNIPSHLSSQVKRGLILKKLEDDPARNMIIAKYAKRIYNSGRRFLIVSDRTKQLQNIKSLMTGRFNIPSEEIGFYTGSLNLGKSKVNGRMKQMTKAISDEERKFAKNKARVILCTYGMIRVGTNIPDASGLILATPQSSSTQIRGRIERFLEGKQQPVIIDIIDLAYHETLSWSKTRLFEYERAKLKVVVKDE